MKKRLLALLLALVMLLGCMPAALAAEPAAETPAAAQIVTSLDNALDASGAYETDAASLAVTVSAARGEEALTPAVQLNGDTLTGEDGVYTLEFTAAGSYVLRIAADEARRELLITYAPAQAEEEPVQEPVQQPAQAPVQAPAAPQTAETGSAATVTVNYIVQKNGTFLFAPQQNVTVSGDLSDTYAYTDKIDAAQGVSALDVLAAAHEYWYDGDNVPSYLNVDDNGTIKDMFEDASGNYCILVNDAIPSSDSGVWYTVSECEVKDGDTLLLAIYQDTQKYSDRVVWFTENSSKLTATTGASGETIELTLVGTGAMMGGEAAAVSGVQLAWLSFDDRDLPTFTDIEGAVTDDAGKASVTLGAVGKAWLTAYIPEGSSAAPIFLPLLQVTTTEAAARDTITIPSDAALFVGQKSKHFIPFTEIKPVSVSTDEQAGTTTYSFELTAGKYNFRISGSDIVTYAGTFQKKADTPYTRTFTDAELKPEGKTKTTIDHSPASNNGYNVADIYLNINAQNYLRMNEGATYQLVNLRSWQTVDSITNNYFIEPDFHYTVLDEDGSEDDSVVSISDTGLITANGGGTAFVYVTYDAIQVESAAGGPFFGAIWPENTGLFVVTVNAEGSSFDTGMTVNAGRNSTNYKISGDKLDAEIDLIYFTGSSGSYTFTPPADSYVEVANPSVANGKMTLGSFESVDADENGAVSVPLTQGRNVVRVTNAEGAEEYQVVTAKQLSYTVNDGKPVKRGDTVTIKFNTVYQPANKLSAIYNMQGMLSYKTPDGALVGSSGTQYNFASNTAAQTIANLLNRTETTTQWGSMISYKKGNAITIPADYEDTVYKLTDGCVIVVGYGDPYGGHRGITLEAGKDPNFTASMRDGYLGILPDIEIKLQDPNAADQDDNGVYQLSSVKQFIWFANAINNGEIDQASNAVLTDDIDLTGESFSPIGTADVPYKGVFDGAGKHITGLSLEASGAWTNTGLFANVKTGTVKNLTVSGTVSTAVYSKSQGRDTIYPYTGGIVGYLDSGTVTNCVSNVNVTGQKSEYVGGVVGGTYYAKEISDCINNGTVTGNTAGGVVGHMKGTLKNCTNNGAVSSASKYAGGIAAVVKPTADISGCTNNGTVTLEASSTSSMYVGGIIAYIEKPVSTFGLVNTITGCTNTGALLVNNKAEDSRNYPHIGGIIGYVELANYNQRLLVQNCKNSGTITLEKSGPYGANAGGIIGEAGTQEYRIIDCLNTADISGYCSVGGIAGDLRGQNNADTDKSKDGPYISGCGNTGNITVKAIDGENSSLEHQAVGGLVGRAELGVQIVNSYNTGSITSAARNVGGLLGRVGPGRDQTSAILTGCYTTGIVTKQGTQEKVGALIGTIDDLSSTEPALITSSDLYYREQELDAVGSGENETVHATAVKETEDILCGNLSFVRPEGSTTDVTPSQAGFDASAVTGLTVDTTKARTLRYDKDQTLALDTFGIVIKATSSGQTFTVGHGLVTFDTSAVNTGVEGRYSVTVNLGSQQAQFSIFVGEIRLGATFTVLDAVSSQPVSGAVITVTNQADETAAAIAANPDGSYTLAPGTYAYTVVAAGYQMKSGSFTVTSYSGNQNIAVTLTPVFAVRFAVKDASGAAVDGAVVTVLSGTTAQTPSQGVYYLPNGDYTYTVTASGYKNVPATAFRVNGAAVTIDVTLESFRETVFFALYGDTVHDSGITHHLWDTTESGKMQTWIPLTEVAIQDGWKVVDVFKAVLDEKGYTYVGADKGYVSSITSPSGITIGEFTNGSMDGWQYRVNGEYVNVGLTQKAISGGDVIVWFYCDNYTQEGSIELVSAPAKTTYYVEEAATQLDTTGMRVNYLGDSMSGTGGTTDITGKVTLSAFDGTAVGKQRIFVNYGGYTASFVVTVANKDAAVTALTIQTQPTKREYAIGESLDLTGLVVKATYSDESEYTIPAEKLTVTGFDSTTAGGKTVTVAYGGKQATFTVTVKAAAPALTWQQALQNVLTYIKITVSEPQFGTSGGEWSVLALARGEVQDQSYYDAYYERVAASVKEKAAAVNDGGKLDKNKSTENSRVILALTAIGKDATNVSGVNLVAPLIADNTWVNKQGINGPVFALIALDTKPYEADDSVREALVSNILEKELATGGWAFSGSSADPDMTGMAIQALAPYYQTNEDVKAAVNRGVTRLSELQESDGGYGSWGNVNPESAAQVIVALSAIGIDANTDERFVKNGTGVVDAMIRFADETGGFKHTMTTAVNAMATDQAGYALVAYSRFKSGKTRLYDMSDKFQPTTPESVQDVIDKIDAIGTVTRTSYADISAAQTAYDALSEADQQKVTNYADLVAAVARYAEILAEEKAAAKQALRAKYAALDLTKYGTEAKKKLLEIYQKGLSDIDKAVSCEQVAAILAKAKADLDAVKPGDITVTFRLIGALEATQSVDLTSNSYLPEYVTWIPTKSYELAENATVYDLFTKALSDAGLRSVGADNNYVSTIYAPSCLGGYALSEFTNGTRSGWMYTVNGSHPSRGLKAVTLNDGDIIIWHYVNDYAHEVSDWNGGGQYPSLGNGTYYNGWLRAADISPEQYVQQLLAKILTVGAHGTATPKLTMSHIGKSVTFTFTPDKGYHVKDVKVDGKSVGAVTTYTVSKLTVSTRIEVTFTNGKLPFTDVRESDWFYSDVVFAYENGLFSGTSSTAFSPNASMTRAMLVTVLYRLEGQPAVNGRSGFSDVQYNGYYEDAVTWAADNGIVNGTSASTFSPNANVTREQMAAILYRYAQYKKYNTAASSGLNGFGDHAAVSSYAVTPMQWAVAEKLVNGSNGKLMPTGNATRAQVAAILHRFVENVAKTTK